MKGTSKTFHDLLVRFSAVSDQLTNGVVVLLEDRVPEQRHIVASCHIDVETSKRFLQPCSVVITDCLCCIQVLPLEKLAGRISAHVASNSGEC
ncbi:hypothetical protein BMUNKI379_25180 [Burkholderia multivorans]|nr:hypothetical protein BMUNKI379_25180 [Burkholderia multivorans]